MVRGGGKKKDSKECLFQTGGGEINIRETGWRSVEVKPKEQV